MPQGCGQGESAGGMRRLSCSGSAWLMRVGRPGQVCRRGTRSRRAAGKNYPATRRLTLGELVPDEVSRLPHQAMLGRQSLNRDVGACADAAHLVAIGRDIMFCSTMLDREPSGDMPRATPSSSMTPRVTRHCQASGNWHRFTSQEARRSMAREKKLGRVVLDANARAATLPCAYCYTRCHVPGFTNRCYVPRLSRSLCATTPHFPAASFSTASAISARVSNFQVHTGSSLLPMMAPGR